MKFTILFLFMDLAETTVKLLHPHIPCILHPLHPCTANVVDCINSDYKYRKTGHNFILEGS